MNIDLGQVNNIGIAGAYDVKGLLSEKCHFHKRRRIYGEKPAKSNANHNG